MSTESNSPPVPSTVSRTGIARWVFWPTAVIVLTFVTATIVSPEGMSVGIAAVQGAIIANFSWWYVLLAFGFVLFCVYLGFSRKGDVKLGRPDHDPEFSLVSWFALLFAAGMGIGLVFYGVTEPLTHFATPKPSLAGQHLQPSAQAQEAIATTFLHWGFQPWAIYVVVGLALAHAIHRRGAAPRRALGPRAAVRRESDARRLGQHHRRRGPGRHRLRGGHLARSRRDPDQRWPQIPRRDRR